MKKILLLLLAGISYHAHAQYGTVNAVLERLEERHGINQNLADVNLDNAKFVLIKDFDGHTERNFLILRGKEATYVEMFDDKQNGQTTSNVFTGDAVRAQHNLLSLRADKLEGQKIALPLTKTLMLTRQKKTLYLIDINTRERWIEESALNKK
ncbi:hypothetical protein CO230_03040 [Chryseobacterium sp. 6424]|uniref:hypothetical protein n=1 Tax=Chryseobacterium sp. 6424 TaxID=2039166 RepID=UPI000EFA5569|nr:hypothetical protein [Chryseobacterium sp. 6424]AYO57191.1 hypothetical protein CO230_03040 [Chryseobacterium sp. 6424]